jgi:hypothetical protein
VDVQFLEGLGTTTASGQMSAFPDFTHSSDGTPVLDQWAWGEGAAARHFQLRTVLPGEPTSSPGPLAFLSDGRLELEVTYASPQPVIDWRGVTNTRVDAVVLAPIEPVSPRSLRQHRRLSAKGLVIETTFFWPPNPTGPVAGYTAPVQAWVETVITGLASRPITLRGEFSQTYHPGHHNFWEEFVFDPHLEEGLDPELRAELTARNVRAVVGSVSFEETQAVWIWGLDDRLRSLSL